MANEFKIRKGLIVEGASGGTVVDVQGSQGQLFSVTDDLSGSIFAVSDISGVPILDVNSSGTIQFSDLGAGTLVTDANGNISVSSGGGAGGPYLPLSAGSGSPLTGALYLGNVGGDQKIQFQRTGGNVYSIEHDSAQLYFYNRTSTEAPLVIQNDGDVLMNAGNVGIGTTSPDFKLQVKGSVALDVMPGHQTEGTIRIGRYDSNTSRYNDIKSYVSSTASQNYLRFSIHNGVADSTIDVMSIKGSGYVGIGTISPNAMLDIHKNDDTVYDPSADDGQRGVGATIQLNNNSTTTNTFGQIMYDTDSSGQAVARMVFLDAGSASSAIAFVTENAESKGERMRIDKAGNVGIGTDSPSAKLQVVTSTGQEGIIINNSNGIQTFQLGHLTSNDSYFQMKNNSDVTKVLLRTDNGSSYINTGNVGIGTTSPGVKLEVNGNGKFYSTIGASDDVRTGLGHYDTSAQAAGVGGQITLGYRYTDAGSYTEGAIIKMYKANGTTGNYSSGLKFQVRENGSSLSTKMVLDPSGNVGIGTSSPAAKLDIRTDTGVLIKGATSAANGKLKFLPASGGRQYNFENDGSSFKIVDASASVTRMYFHYNGNLGIGTTSPGAKLEVSDGSSGFTGNYNARTAAVFEGSNSAGTTLSIMSPDTGYSGIFFGNNTSETYGQLAFDHTSNSFKFINGGGTERMRITSDGKVGIGTTSPGVKLQVNGGIRAVGTTSTTGQIDASPDFGAFRFYNGNTFRGGLGTGQWASVGDNTDIVQYLNNVNYYISNGSTALVKVEAGGNVGIGTTSPDTKLHIEGNLLVDAYNLGEDNGIFFREGFLTTNQPSITVWDMSNSGASPDGLSINANDGIRFRENGGEVARFKDGQLGIGTNSPVVKLDVEAGNTGTANGDSTTAAILRAGRQNLWFQNQRTAAGTDWNNNTFKIIAKIDTTSHQSINFVNDASYNEHIDIYTGNQVFNTRFNANGNVGIGTTSPAQHQSTTETVLHIANSNVASLNLDSGGANGDCYVLSSTSSGNFMIYNDDNNSYPFIIDDADNVGLGTTTPNAKLDVQGTQGQLFSVTDDLSGDIFSVADISGVPIMNVNSDGTSYFDGNVGIGTTTPGQKLDVSGNIRGNNFYANDSTVPSLYMERGDGLPQPIIRLVKSNDNLLIGHTAIDEVIFYDDAGEAMRLDGSGNLGIGTTSPAYKLDVSGTANLDVMIAGNAGNFTIGLQGAKGTFITNSFATNYVMHCSGSASNFAFTNGNTNSTAITFLRGSISGSVNSIGSISMTATSTSYNTTSDYRLKENIEKISNAIDRVKNLKPIRFSWISEPELEKVDGFLAHEVAEVVPEAVTGEKDAIDYKGEQELQMLENSKLIPLLTAALQQAIDKIEILEQRIQLIENK